MKRPQFLDSWTEEIKQLYHYDQLEIWNEGSDYGYFYSYSLRRKTTFDLVEKYITPGSSILDVAGAGGNFTLPLAEKGYRLSWNDLRKDLIPYIQSKYEKGDVAFFPGNVFEQDFEESFDCILALEVIEHVAHPDEFLLALKKFLKPGGTLILSTPNGAYFNNKLPRFHDCPDPSAYEGSQFKPNSDGHIFLFAPEELRQLAESAGLICKECVTFTNFFTGGYLKSHLALNILPQKLVFSLESLSQSLPEFLSNRINVAMAAVFSKED